MRLSLTAEVKGFNLLEGVFEIIPQMNECPLNFSHFSIDTNCYSRNKITIIFVKIIKSCVVFKASPDLCSSCIQRSRAKSKRFRQCLQGSRSDSTHSYSSGFQKTYCIL